MRDEAFRRIGHLYPKATLADGSKATVIAWLWARTVVCPNPACGAALPLVSSYALSTKKGKAGWVTANCGCSALEIATKPPERAHSTKTSRGNRWKFLEWSARARIDFSAPGRTRA
jgi:putative DNA methylase